MNTVSLRHNRILALLQDTGSVRVDELAAQLKVSEVSVRKDLATLERQGKLIRRLGGAVANLSLPQSAPATGVNTPSSVTPNKARAAIAEAAAQLVSPGSRLIIDSGQTTQALLHYISGLPGLVIMTNALTTANLVLGMPNSPTLLMPGGTWDRQSQSFQGQQAEHTLGQYDFDFMFVGADGIDARRGTTTFNELTGLSQAMAKTAQHVVLMAETKKVGRRLPNLELSWRDIQTFIADGQLPAATIQQIQSFGVDVIRAGEGE